MLGVCVLHAATRHDTRTVLARTPPPRNTYTYRHNVDSSSSTATTTTTNHRRAVLLLMMMMMHGSTAVPPSAAAIPAAAAASLRCTARSMCHMDASVHTRRQAEEMAPNSGSAAAAPLITKDKEALSENFGAQYFGIRFKTEIVWKNVLAFVVLHILTAYASYLILTSQCKSYTLIFAIALYIGSGILGITAGAHRLWTHRSYKAKWPLRLVLMISNCICLQNHIYEWTRDHRVHHKYTDTDADPHNTNRSFFFSHLGWLMMKKHPEVIRKGKGIDMSDLRADPIVMFQRKYYKSLAIFLAYVLPSAIPVLLWNEDIVTSYLIAGVWKHMVTLHSTWSVNSLAHMWGDKPYDETIKPSENLLVSLLAQGEGYHNYHHTFPYDYSTSEYRFGLNLTTAFIDFMAFLGQATDRKKVSEEMILNRKLRTGNLSKK